MTCGVDNDSRDKIAAFVLCRSYTPMPVLLGHLGVDLEYNFHICEFFTIYLIFPAITKEDRRMENERIKESD